MINDAICKSVLKFLVLVTILTVNLSIGYAAQSGDSSAVNFTGILKRRPCHINNDQIIYIHFGEMGVNKIDGVNYAKTIPYSIKCEEIGDDLSLKLYLRADHPWFDYTTIVTTKTDLGINILQDGKLMEINSGLTINYHKPPVLVAVPIKRIKSDLSEGSFTATATLLAEYD